MARAGVIGAGLMGTACTRRLLAAGFEVLACDVDEAKRKAIAQVGAKAVATAAELARECRIMIIAVFSTDQVEQVIEGPDGALWVLEDDRAESKGRLLKLTPKN